MSKPKVVVTRRIPKAGLERVKEECEVRQWDSEEPIPRETLLEWVEGIDGLYCLLTEKIDDELLDAAGDNLKVVSTMSVGYDHVDVAACLERGVAVGNTPGVLTDTTADFAMTLILTTARRVPEAIDAIRAGDWTTWKPEWMAGQDIAGSTVGIVGLGRIGATVAKRLGGFDCKILYYDVAPIPDVADPLGAQFVDMDTLLAESDFITVHTQLNDSTYHMFNAEAFKKMKPTAIFVNTSRGGVVDQDALYDALVNGDILAAGLDVTIPEPLPPDHPLMKLPNAVVAPHIASASVETRAKMSVIAAENLIAGVKGEPLPAGVTEQ
jgi:lactate dehydrogenase-like 2-hydroxyacid dehydrogenase